MLLEKRFTCAVGCSPTGLLNRQGSGSGGRIALPQLAPSPHLLKASERLVAAANDVCLRQLLPRPAYFELNGLATDLAGQIPAQLT